MTKPLINIFAYTFATLIGFGSIFIFCAVISLPFWLLWNWLIPDIFGFSAITWLQAFGLWFFLILIRSSSFRYKDMFKKIPRDTDGTESSPFGDNTWNQWVEQVRKKYEA